MSTGQGIAVGSIWIAVSIVSAFNPNAVGFVAFMAVIATFFLA